MRSMKNHALLTGFILCIAPVCIHAGWEVSTPGPAVVPREPFFQSKMTQTALVQPQPIPYRPTVYPVKVPPSRVLVPPPRVLAPSPLGVYAISISGSLKENLERIMSRYHWQVIWKAPYDYNFDGRITGSSLPNVIEKLLQPFPLQAVMYMSNRTLAVSSRPRYRA